MNYHGKTTCVRGHDRTLPGAVVGRGECRKCKYARNRSRNRPTNPAGPALPIEPLRAYLAQTGQTMYSFGVSTERRLNRWTQVGYAPLFSADEFITQELGIHPYQIYGDAFFADDALA
jgi:hypothetical protein